MERYLEAFDICIVCALYEEAQAVFNEFSTRCRVSFTKAFSRWDRYEYRYTAIHNIYREPLNILVTWLSGSGSTQTGLDLKPLLYEFRPRFVAMTGICAGDRKKVKLGDIVVAEYAYHYEEGKIVTELNGALHHIPEMQTSASTSQVIHYVRGFEGWKEPLKMMMRHKLKRELNANEEPHCIVAPMASGMAVRQDNPFLWLREKYNRNTVALDMEAATFYRVLRAVSYIHGLVVKSVCDYADMHKNDAYHEYAARASAVYLLFFIQEYVTEQTMPRLDVPPSSSRSVDYEVSLKNGAHALRQRGYVLARQLLKEAIKIIPVNEHPEDAAKANYLLALALLDGKLPREQGKTTMELVEQLMNTAISLHKTWAYLSTFAQLKEDFFNYCGYRNRLGEVWALLDQAGQVKKSSYDLELLSFFEQYWSE
jgi:nucleoside phosphorylase